MAPEPVAALSPSRPTEHRALALQEPEGNTAVDRTIAELQRAATANPTKHDTWVLLGRAWVEKARLSGDPGHYHSANAAAELALALEPQSALALGLRGLVLLNDHRFRDALALAEGILARAPGDLVALGVRSDAALELGRMDEALTAAQRMLDEKPSLPSYARAAHLRWLLGDPVAAKSLYRLAFDAGRGQKDPEPTAWVLVQAADLFWNLGDVEGAVAGYELALKQLPEYAPALVGHGRATLATAPHSAARALATAMEKSPSVETAWLLSDAREAAGDLTGAQAAAVECVRLGRRLDGRTLARFFAAKKRDLGEAVQLVDRELADRPGGQTLAVAAAVYWRVGRVAEALGFSEQARRTGVREASLLFHAGMIRLALGDAVSGRALVAEALALNPQFDRSESAEARALLGATP